MGSYWVTEAPGLRIREIRIQREPTGTPRASRRAEREAKGMPRGPRWLQVFKNEPGRDPWKGDGVPKGSSKGARRELKEFK